jgi:hypothetical protein
MPVVMTEAGAGWAISGPTVIPKEVLFYRVPPWPQAQTVYNRMPVEDRGVERLGTLRDMPRSVHGGLKTGFES